MPFEELDGKPFPSSQGSSSEQFSAETTHQQKADFGRIVTESGGVYAQQLAEIFAARAKITFDSTLNDTQREQMLKVSDQKRDRVLHAAASDVGGIIQTVGQNRRQVVADDKTAAAEAKRVAGEEKAARTKTEQQAVEALKVRFGGFKPVTDAQVKELADWMQAVERGEADPSKPPIVSDYGPQLAVSPDDMTEYDYKTMRATVGGNEYQMAVGDGDIAVVVVQDESEVQSLPPGTAYITAGQANDPFSPKGVKIAGGGEKGESLEGLADWEITNAVDAARDKHTVAVANHKDAVAEATAKAYATAKAAPGDKLLPEEQKEIDDAIAAAVAKKPKDFDEVASRVAYLKSKGTTERKMFNKGLAEAAKKYRRVTTSSGEHIVVGGRLVRAWRTGVEGLPSTVPYVVSDPSNPEAAVLDAVAVHNAGGPVGWLNAKGGAFITMAGSSDPRIQAAAASTNKVAEAKNAGVIDVTNYVDQVFPQLSDGERRAVKNHILASLGYKAAP